MRIKSLRDLLVHKIEDLSSAENQITKALPKLIKKAETPELKKALEKHLRETEQQVKRLERIRALMSLASKGPKCKGMEGILSEGEESLSDVEHPAMDAAIIASAQSVEHYEIAGYGCAIAYADALDELDVRDLLTASLTEEKAADEKLTELAESGINAMAESETARDV